MKQCIKRVEYKQQTIQKGSKHKSEPFRMMVLVEVDDHHYVKQYYNWVQGKWVDSEVTSFYDGTKSINGTVVFTNDVVQELFRLKLIFEGFCICESDQLKEVM